MSLKKVRPNITFIIFTFNEEDRIAYPISCFLPYGPVLVVDNESTDRTQAVAKKAGATVITYKNNGWVETKEEADFVFKHVTTEWIYWGFADEMIPKTCLEKFQKIVEEDTYKIVIQKKKTLLYTPFDEYVPNYVETKLFKKNALDFSGNTIHQMGKFAFHVKPYEVLYLPPIDEYSIYHFSRYTTETVINSFNRYSNIHASTTNTTRSGLKVIINPAITFCSIYFFQGAFRYGIKGFIIAMQFAIYTFLVMAKTYEQKHNITLQSIEEEFVKEKIKLLNTSPKSSLSGKLVAKGKVSAISKLHKRKKFNNA